MTNNNYDNQTTGGIVAANFAAASVFQRHGIDFCCHGSTPFTEACRARGLDPEAVAHELDNATVHAAPASDLPLLKLRYDQLMMAPDSDTKELQKCG